MTLEWSGLTTSDGKYTIGQITTFPSGTDQWYLQRWPGPDIAPRPCPTVAEAKAQAEAHADGRLDEFEDARSADIRAFRSRQARAEAAAATARARELLIEEGRDHADDWDDWTQTLDPEQRQWIIDNTPEGSEL